jgi:hypothetical protein
MIGDDYILNYNHISRQRIQDMAYDIISQVADKIKSCSSGMSAYNYMSLLFKWHVHPTTIRVNRCAFSSPSHLHYICSQLHKNLSFCFANLWKLQLLQEVYLKLSLTFLRSWYQVGKLTCSFVWMESQPCWVTDQVLKL